MKDTPPGWPRISSGLYYRDAAAAIDWLCQAFGFEVKLRVEGENGRIEHSELTYGEGLIMVGQEEEPDATPRFGRRRVSPVTAGCNTQSLLIYVDDVDAHCAQARARGATIVAEPAVHDYGEDYWADRTYAALDPDGHVWWFTQRLRSLA
ncbi:MAG TPA: VOC family protein [Burkholderiaceae bacterium]|nr:VOC family protein [Burkholderiaceae bacterium]